MEKQKPIICRLRPAEAIGSCLLSYDDICLTEECRKKTPRADHT